MQTAKENKILLAYAKGIGDEISSIVKDYLDFKNKLTYEEVCKLVDLRNTLEVLGFYEKGEEK